MCGLSHFFDNAITSPLYDIGIELDSFHAVMTYHPE